MLLPKSCLITLISVACIQPSPAANLAAGRALTTTLTTSLEFVSQPGLSQDSLFGHAVSLSHGKLAVGAPHHDSKNGSLFVYDTITDSKTLTFSLSGRDTEELGNVFSLTKSLLAVRRKSSVEVHDLDTRELVGSPISVSASSLSISTSNLVIGDGEFQEGRGRALIFDTNNSTDWSQPTTIEGPAGAGSFGLASSIGTDRIVVTSPTLDIGPLTRAGSVQVFERTAPGMWIPMPFEHTGGVQSEGFGFSVAMSEDDRTVVVGSPAYGEARGKVTIFRYVGGQWVPLGQPVEGQDKLDLFGRSVAISGDGNRIAVSSAELANGRTGELKVFDFDGQSWIQVAEMVGIAGNQLGNSAGSVKMSEDGQTVVVGVEGASHVRLLEVERPVSPPSGSPTSSPTPQRTRHPTPPPTPTPQPTPAPTLNLESTFATEEDWNVTLELYGQPASTADERVEFGSSVILSDGYAVVGAPMNDDPFENGGAVYVYDGADGSLMWQRRGGSNEFIGDRIAVSGTRVAIRRRTVVQVFDFTTNSFVGSNVRVRGSSLSLAGDVLVVGDESYDNNAGLVTIFEFDGSSWLRVQEIIGESRNGRLGSSTSISEDGSRIAIGSPNVATPDWNRAGKVVVLEFDTTDGMWKPIGSEISGNEAVQQFGASVALSGDGSTFVAGSTGSQGENLLQGRISVYKFVGGDWMEDASFTGDRDRDRFGRAVSISFDGSRVAGSSYFHRGQRGQVRVFEAKQGFWEVVTVVKGENNFDRLGYGFHSVSLSRDGNQIGVGYAWAPDSDGNSVGKIQVIDVMGSESNQSDPPTVPPTEVPSGSPTSIPTPAPTPGPTLAPTPSPTQDSASLTSQPTAGETGLEADGVWQYGQSVFGTPSSQFGTTVLLRGGRMFVGAPAALGELGAVFLYDTDSQALVWSVVGSANEQIGSLMSASADGIRLAFAREEGLSVHVYDIAPGGQFQPIGSPIQLFDPCTALEITADGASLAIGQASIDRYTGRVTIFSLQGESSWVRSAILEGESVQGRFGNQVSFSESAERLAVAAPYDNTNGSRAGLVQLYEVNGDGNWMPLAEALPGPEVNGRFGSSIALSGDGETLAIGSPNNHVDGVSKGEVYVFRLTEGVWDQVGSSIIGDGDRDRFGRSITVSHDGSRLAGSSYFHRGQRGQVRIFDFSENEWYLVQELEGENVQDRLGFGFQSLSLSPSGDWLAVGIAQAKDVDGNDIGKAQIYGIDGTLTDSPSGKGFADNAPSRAPTENPTVQQTAAPSDPQTRSPTKLPSAFPSQLPTYNIAEATLFPTVIDHSDDATSTPTGRPSFLRASMSPSESPQDQGVVNPVVDTIHHTSSSAVGSVHVVFNVLITVVISLTILF